MEDGAKENTALNIQKPLEILVTDEDKHGTDIACMSDFLEYILSKQYKGTIKTGSLLQDREMIVVSIEDIKDA